MLRLNRLVPIFAILLTGTNFVQAIGFGANARVGLAVGHGNAGLREGAQTSATTGTMLTNRDAARFDTGQGRVARKEFRYGVEPDGSAAEQRQTQQAESLPSYRPHHRQRRVKTGN